MTIQNIANQNDALVPLDMQCQQCFALIRSPDWIEECGHRTNYLWRCEACDYEFETIAIYPETTEALAA